MSHTPHPDCPATSLRRHGTYSAARYGCRCPRAIEDRRRYNKLHHHGYSSPLWIDATGTRRRIQALCALGWSRPEMAARLGVGPRSMGHYLTVATVTTSTAARVRRLYDELAMHAGSSQRVRAHARRQGWVPPLAWDDDEIDNPAARPRGSVKSDGPVLDEATVELTVRGERAHGVVLPRPERNAAIRRCRALGLPAHEIARRVGVSTRTVDRVVSASPSPASQTTSAA